MSTSILDKLNLIVSFFFYTTKCNIHAVCAIRIYIFPPSLQELNMNAMHEAFNQIWPNATHKFFFFFFFIEKLEVCY